MKNHRIISYSCAAAATILLALPVAAQAGSSTLSGYGGPGEGNQAVLGSALVGGHGGGGGNSGAGSGRQGGGASSEGSATSAPAGESGASQGQSTQSASRPRSSSSESGSARGNAKRASRPTTSSTAHGSSQAQPAAAAQSYYPAAERVPAGGQGSVLGLTGDDLLYVILALVILVLVGLFTRRLEGSASSARTRG
jgi:hypothetical protein